MSLAWGAHQLNSQISGLGMNLISHIFYLAFHTYFCNMVNVFNVWSMWSNLIYKLMWAMEINEQLSNSSCDMAYKFINSICLNLPLNIFALIVIVFASTFIF
jgi:hypothetical protein